VFPFHGVGDVEHHHHAMAAKASKLLQNLQHTIRHSCESRNFALPEKDPSFRWDDGKYTSVRDDDEPVGVNEISYWSPTRGDRHATAAISSARRRSLLREWSLPTTV
jgi:hypothetical protein